MTGLREQLQRLRDRIIEIICREGGRDPVALAHEVCDDPWMLRGVNDAARRLGLGEREVQEATAYAFAYATGAKEALLLSRAILSDPAVRGRELEALKLIDEGVNHAAVVVALREQRPSGDGESRIIVFPRNFDGSGKNSRKSL